MNDPCVPGREPDHPGGEEPRRGGVEATSARRAGGRFRRVVQHYLQDFIYGANDGIVTTLAVVSGVVGAALPPRVILIMGFANLLGDGFSMGASNYLSRRSRPAGEEQPESGEAMRHGLATIVGFVPVGLVPLLAYLLPWFGEQPFWFAVGMAMATLFGVGAARAIFTNRTWARAGTEMLVVGALASAVAYAIGALAASLTGGRI